jgi:hypothetical protein
MERVRMRLVAPTLLFLAFVCPPLPISIAQPQSDPEPCNGPQGEVTGIITDPAGSPVSGAIIKYYGVQWDHDCRLGKYKSFETRSDSNGAYRIEVPLGKGRVLSVERTDVGGFPEDMIHLPDVVPGGIRANHQFRLFHIRGTVVDASGVPIGEGMLTYYPKPNAPICGTGLPEGPIRDGRFEAVVHAIGTYVLWVRPGRDGASGIVSHPDMIDVDSDTTVAITADGDRVEGVVVGVDGKALSGVIVYARGKTAEASDRSDEKGHYLLILPRGAYRLGTIYPLGQVQVCEPESISISGPSHVSIRMKGPLAPPALRSRIRPRASSVDSLLR